MAAEADDADPVVERLLAAAQAEFERVGIKRAVMGRVAKDAGVGRATLYRRFPDKAGLVDAVLQRKLRKDLAALEETMAAIDDPAERLVEGFVATHELIRTDRLLARLVESEPETVLPLFTVQGGGALELAKAFLIGQLTALDLPPGVDLEIAAELPVRLLHSLMLTPGGTIGADREAARRLATGYLAPAMFPGFPGRRA